MAGGKRSKPSGQEILAAEQKAALKQARKLVRQTGRDARELADMAGYIREFGESLFGSEAGADAPFSSLLRRLSPAENVKTGHSPKAERYALKGERVRKGMATLSKRQRLKLETAEKTGQNLSLEKAAEARKGGGLGYKTAASEQQAEKQREVRLIQRLRRDVGRLGRVKDLRGREYRAPAPDQYLEWRERKLSGEFLGNEWFGLMDAARDKRIKDPALADLQSSAIVKFQ